MRSGSEHQVQDETSGEISNFESENEDDNKEPGKGEADGCTQQ